MTILFLIRSLTVGGSERQLVVLAKGLRERGHEVAVAVFYSGGELEKELSNAGICIRPLNKQGRWDVLGCLFRLAQVVKKERPDVLHGYLSEPNIMAVLLKPFFPQIRVVWGVRNAIRDLSQIDWLDRMVLKVKRQVSYLVDLVIANSQTGYLDRLATGYPAAKMIVIPNGIDTERFRPDSEARRRLRSEWNVKHHEPLIGIVGRLDARKDHPIFLGAASLLAKRWKDVRFVCVGDGPDEYTRWLLALTKSLGLEKLVLWVGTRQDMPAVYNALDIAVSSSCSEGLPNVIGEAMACGVRCVATDVGDSAWVVGDTGEIVPPKDPVALANAIERILNGKAYDSSRVRQRIVDHLSISSLSTRTEHALSALLKNSTASICDPVYIPSQKSDGVLQRSSHSLRADNSPDKSASVTRHA